MRAESEQIVSFGASGDAGGVVVGVGIGLGASGLEDLRINRGLAGLRASVGARAAVLGRVESGAGALAGHHALVVA